MKCDACLFADSLVEPQGPTGTASEQTRILPEHERYAFSYATGIGRVLSGVPVLLCDEHMRDAQGCAKRFRDAVAATAPEIETKPATEKPS